MNKFNLKNLAIAVVIISALMVGSAYLFSKVAFKTQKLPTPSSQLKPKIQSPSANVNPAAGSTGAAGVQPGTAQKPIKPEPVK